MAARIVVRGAAHLRHEQRELVQLELSERLAEVELAREPEAMDRARAVLTEINLVDVGVQDFALAVAQLERDGHEGLSDLAPPSREAAARVRQEVAAHQLLGQSAGAFADLARRDVHE